MKSISNYIRLNQNQIKNGLTSGSSSDDDIRDVSDSMGHTGWSTQTQSEKHTPKEKRVNGAGRFVHKTSYVKNKISKEESNES